MNQEHYYTPLAAHWFCIWRSHVSKAKDSGGVLYCYAATIAQTQYVISLALKV